MTKAQALKSIKASEKLMTLMRKNVGTKKLGDWQLSRTEIKKADAKIKRAKKYYKAGEYNKINKIR